VDNAIGVQVFNSLGQLEGQLPDSGLSQVEFPCLEVVEQVAARHVVQDDVVVVTVLKDINQVDDVGVLTHLQHFNFSPLLKHFNVSHVALFHLLDRHFPLVFLVEG